MAVSDLTTSVTFQQLDWMHGYRFGDDGSIWSRRKCCRWNQLTDEWRLVHTRKCDKYGHLKIRVTVDGKKVAFFVHRLILEAFVGPCPDGMEGCHDPDPDPTNNRLSNLRWDTRQANSDDCARHGRMNRAKGSAQGKAKLTESDIPEVRRLRNIGMTYRAIAARYGVAHRTIILVVTGKTWAHV